jgi:myo-inositol-1(or 4)-monophosphatase
MVDWIDVLLEAAKRVEDVSRRLKQSPKGRRILGIGAAGDKTMLVDREAEDSVLEVITQVDDIRIITEEGGETGEKNARWTVVIDPIDGSSNFERGIPFYCTSLAVLEGKTVDSIKFAVVKNLVSGDTYLASRGGGAMKGGKQIYSSGVVALEEAVLVVDTSRTTGKVLRALIPLGTSVKRQVHFGANALEACFLAEGLVDGMVDIRRKMRITDFAGGYLIAKEAGAIITDERGGEFAPSVNLKERFSFVMGANRKIHRGILAKMT